jgi:hypothetical protein
MRSRTLQGNCKICNECISHEWECHWLRLPNVLEEYKWQFKVKKHFSERHENSITAYNRIRYFKMVRKIVAAAVIDGIQLVLFPVCFIVSLLHKGFEWVNDRIGIFD